MLAAEGWTPVFLRANTGLGVRENGVALTALLRELAEARPVGVTRIALVGHSMGGLILRAAGAVATGVERPWTGLVSDVVTLGTPHLGAPDRPGVGHGSRGLVGCPRPRFGRILDWRSVGVHDLVAGLAEDVPALPHARYRLVAATLTSSPASPRRARRGRHPGAGPVGDGRDRDGAELFPEAATVLHVAVRPLRAAQPSRRPPRAARLARLSGRWHGELEGPRPQLVAAPRRGNPLSANSRG